jgi:hypothetical protein
MVAEGVDLLKERDGFLSLPGRLFSYIPHAKVKNEAD